MKSYKRVSVNADARRREKRALSVLSKRVFGMPLHLRKHWKMIAASIGNIEEEPLIVEANSERHTVNDALIWLNVVDQLCTEDKLPYVVLCEDTDTQERSIQLSMPRSVTAMERYIMARDAHTYIQDKFGIEVTGMQFIA